jgi:hypothetical protein
MSEKLSIKRQGVHDNYIIFGDGTTSQIAEKKKTVNDKGESVWMFLVWPSNEQRKKYVLKKNKNYDPVHDIMRLEIPAVYVEVIQNTPKKTRMWARCTFDIQPTNLTERDVHLTEKIMYLERNLSSVKTSLAKAYVKGNPTKSFEDFKNECGKKKGKIKTTYSIVASCENCGEDTDLEVPKGIKVKDYISHSKCEHCDCQTLVKSDLF